MDLILPNGKVISYNNRLYYNDGTNKYLLDQDDYTTLSNNITNTQAGIFNIGDIKYSTRSSLGSNWLLCNGSTITGDYPGLNSYLQMQTFTNGQWSQVTPKTAAQCGYEGYTENYQITKVGNFYTRVCAKAPDSNTINVLILYSTTLKNVIQNPNSKEYTFLISTNSNDIKECKLLYVGNSYILCVLSHSDTNQNGSIDIYKDTAINGSYSHILSCGGRMDTLNANVIVNGSACAVATYDNYYRNQGYIYVAYMNNEFKSVTPPNNGTIRHVYSIDSYKFVVESVVDSVISLYSLTLYSTGSVTWSIMNETYRTAYLDSNLQVLNFNGTRLLTISKDGKGIYDLSLTSPTKVNKNFTYSPLAIASRGGNSYYFFSNNNYIGYITSTTNTSCNNYTSAQLNTTISSSNTIVTDGIAAYVNSRYAWLDNKYILPKISSPSTNSQAVNAFIRAR